MEEVEGRAELGAALARALADLKLATEARREQTPTSPGLLQAVRREREVMERIQELVERLRLVDP